MTSDKYILSFIGTINLDFYFKYKVKNGVLMESLVPRSYVWNFRLISYIVLTSKILGL
jgi:hypothetical protein